MSAADLAATGLGTYDVCLDDVGVNYDHLPVVVDFARTTIDCVDAELGTFLASDGADADFFGRSVVVSGGRVVIGAYGDDDHGASAGSAYLFDVVSDCNGNNTADIRDIADGTSADCQPNGIPDNCEPDCNNNGVPDDCDITQGTSQDIDFNGVPDECEPGVCGDLTNDGFVNLDDFATFATCFALDFPLLDCDVAEFACCDMTGNGRVDLDDFASFAVMFATTPTTTVPNCIP